MKVLLDLPIWSFGLIFVGGLVALSVGLALVVRPFVQRGYAGQNNDVLGTGFVAVGTLYAIVAGMLVFGVYRTAEDAETVCADEAATLTLMYHQTEAFPQPRRDQAQQAILSYTRSVIEDEWPALEDSRGSPRTNSALDGMFSVWAPMEPDSKWVDQYDVSVDQLNEVLLLREERIAYSRESLNPVYWVMLFGGAGLTILHLCLLYSRNRSVQLAMIGVASAMLGLVLFLLIELNLPFRGDISVSPASFGEALAKMENMRR